MADNVDNDVCSYMGKSNSTSTNSLKQIDLTQSNHHHQHRQSKQHQRRHHASHQPLDDEDHINSTNSVSANVSEIEFAVLIFFFLLPHLLLTLIYSDGNGPADRIFDQSSHFDCFSLIKLDKKKREKKKETSRETTVVALFDYWIILFVLFPLLFWLAHSKNSIILMKCRNQIEFRYLHTNAVNW